MDVKTADRLNEPAVERGFLLGLTQRGRRRADIKGVDLAHSETKSLQCGPKDARYAP
jgi:hypothetical protein